MQVTFQGAIPKTIPQQYKTKISKQNTVAILGSSKTTTDILNYMDMCSNSVKVLIRRGKNVVHGCGTTGIMGAALASAIKYSDKDWTGNSYQNLGIVTDKRWGNEDTEHCTMLASAASESDRIDKFAEVADTMLIFPGSVTTLQEAATLITKNYYGNIEERKKIILVGREFFSGLNNQYKTLYDNGLINCKPSELYTIVDTLEEINKNI